MSLYSFFGLLLVSLLGHSVAVSAQQPWKQIKPPGAGFTIEFPRTPQTAWKDLPAETDTVPTLVSFISRDDGIDFLAMYSNFPTGSFSGGAQSELDKLRNSSVLAVRGKLLSEAKRSVSGAPARQIAVAFHDGETIATVLFLLNGTHLYQAICVAPKSRQNDPDISRFINSLALVPR